MISLINRCAEFKVENSLYELFTLGVILALLLGYLILTARGFMLGKPDIKIDNISEFILVVTSLYLALPFHESLHALGLKLCGTSPKFSIERFKEYIFILKVEDGLSREFSYGELVTICSLPFLGSTLFSILSLNYGVLDYPLFVLSLLNIMFAAWDTYLILVLRDIREANFIYKGTNIWVLGNCKLISEKLATKMDTERYTKYWAGWTWFFFFIVIVMFILVEVGSIGFREGFTLQIGPLLIFSVEPVGEGFRTVFNPLNAFMISAILALPMAYFSKKIKEWLI